MSTFFTKPLSLSTLPEYQETEDFQFDSSRPPSKIENFNSEIFECLKAQLEKELFGKLRREIESEMNGFKSLVASFVNAQLAKLGSDLKSFQNSVSQDIKKVSEEREAEQKLIKNLTQNVQKAEEDLIVFQNRHKYLEEELKFSIGDCVKALQGKISEIEIQLSDKIFPDEKIYRRKVSFEKSNDKLRIEEGKPAVPLTSSLDPSAFNGLLELNLSIIGQSKQDELFQNENFELKVTRQEDSLNLPSSTRKSNLFGDEEDFVISPSSKRKRLTDAKTSQKSLDKSGRGSQSSWFKKLWKKSSKKDATINENPKPPARIQIPEPATQPTCSRPAEFSTNIRRQSLLPAEHVVEEFPLDENSILKWVEEVKTKKRLDQMKCIFESEGIEVGGSNLETEDGEDGKLERAGELDFCAGTFEDDEEDAFTIFLPEASVQSLLRKHAKFN